jgi:hypothetical protein
MIPITMNKPTDITTLLAPAEELDEAAERPASARHVKQTDSVAVWGQAMVANDYAIPSVGTLHEPAFEQAFSCSAPVSSWESVMQGEDSTATGICSQGGACSLLGAGSFCTRMVIA